MTDKSHQDYIQRIKVFIVKIEILVIRSIYKVRSYYLIYEMLLFNIMFTCIKNFMKLSFKN